MDDELRTEIIDTLRAIRDAANSIKSDQYGPGAFEAIAMALAGEGLRRPLGEALGDIATAVAEIADK